MVPANYFGQLENVVMVKTNQAEPKVVAIGTRSKRAMWYSAAAAACVAFAVLFFWPKTNAVQTEKSFAELLEQTDLSEQEVDEIVTDEVYYEMVMDNIY
jgi:hypothetical protein